MRHSRPLLATTALLMIVPSQSMAGTQGSTTRHSNCSAATAKLSHRCPKIKKHRSTRDAAQALQQEYAAFGRPQSLTDVAPTDVVAIATGANSGVHPVGADPSESRRFGGDDNAIYAIPSTNGVCMILRVPTGKATAMGCTDVEHSRFMSGFTRGPGGWLIWGIADDHVRAVKIDLGGGHVRESLLDHNGFAVTSAKPPLSITPAT